MTSPALLSIDNLAVRFHTDDGVVKAINDVDIILKRGECLGIVGESGSGKTQLAMSIMGLLAPNAQRQGDIVFDGRNIGQLPAHEMNRLRGNRIAMIFQDPMTSLTPHMTVERQMTEVLTTHKGMSRQAATARARDMLDLVGISDAETRLAMYPHEFSGGMRQRIMIAMALLCEPDVIIADEPTTALDVTIQAQILEVMQRLKQETGVAIILISHDLGVVAGLCDRIAIMYAGSIVESGPVEDIYRSPQHPYTVALLKSVPRTDRKSSEALIPIPGEPPDLERLPDGCSFAARCEFAFDICRTDKPALLDTPATPAGHLCACHLTTQKSEKA